MRVLPTWIVVIAIVLIGSGLLLWHTTFSANAPIVMGGTAVPPVTMLDTNTVATGKLLYAEHCISCHGAVLQGVANWKERLADGSLPPPPHDSSGHTWHHENGRYNQP